MKDTASTKSDLKRLEKVKENHKNNGSVFFFSGLSSTNISSNKFKAKENKGIVVYFWFF